jgi:hypothetical protein
MDESKPFYLSKTLWTNVLMFAMTALNTVFPTVEIGPEFTAAIFVLVNTVLRATTKGAITIS